MIMIMDVVVDLLVSVGKISMIDWMLVWITCPVVFILMENISPWRKFGGGEFKENCVRCSYWGMIMLFVFRIVTPGYQTSPMWCAQLLAIIPTMCISICLDIFYKFP